MDSIVNQTYKNLEIICVNDGSTDSSPDIITKYANKDSRIKIINQKNSILIISLCINIFNMGNQMHSLKENAFDIFQIMNDVKQLLIEHNLYEHEKYCFLQHKFNVYTYLLFKVAPEFQGKFYDIARRNLHNEALAQFSIKKNSANK